MSSCKILYIKVGWDGGDSHWLVFDWMSYATVSKHLTTLTVCIWLDVHTVGQSAFVSLPCIAETCILGVCQVKYAPIIDQILFFPSLEE